MTKQFRAAVQRRAALETKLREQLKRITLFDRWEPDMFITDLGAHFKFTMQLKVPTGLPDEHLEMTQHQYVEKHLVLVDGVDDAPFYELLIIEMIKDMFNELATMFMNNHKEDMMATCNVLTLISKSHLSAHAPGPALLPPPDNPPEEKQV